MKSLQTAGLTDDEIDKVTWQNAARWYQFDPFEHRPRDEAPSGRCAPGPTTSTRRRGNTAASTTPTAWMHNAALFMWQSSEQTPERS